MIKPKHAKKIRSISCKIKERIIFIIFILISVFLTVEVISCNMDNSKSLGLAVDSQKQDNILESGSKQVDDSTVMGVDLAFNEQAFYELKSKQSNENVLDNINIRKAIFYAIDRERIVAELLGDYSGVLNSIFNINSDYYYPAWNEYSYDTQKAQEFLKKAGYDIQNPLYLTIGTNSDSISRQAIEEIIKENLEEIGIKIWISNKDSRDWFGDSLKSGNYELGIWAIGTPDLISLSNYFGSGKIPSLESEINKNCNNYYWYVNKDFDQSLDKILSESSPEIKKQLSEEMQNMLAKDAFSLPLYSRVFAVAYNRKVSGIEIDINSGSYFKNVEQMSISQSGTDEEEENDENEDSENINSVESLVCGFQQEPYSFNPLIADNTERDNINELILRGLWNKKESGEYEPFLVDSITTSTLSGSAEEGIRLSLRANIKLKSNIFWQDGTPITSEDIVDTIKSIKNMSSGSFINNGIDYNIIKSIDVIDDKQFVVNFSEYSYKWKELFNIIFPSKLLEDNKIENLFYEDTAGFGPYKLKEWIKGEYILLEKNIYYSGKMPDIDAIKFVFNSDLNSLIGFLKSGSIDILSIPADTLLFDEIKEDESLDLIIKPGNLWEHLAICLKPKQE